MNLLLVILIPLVGAVLPPLAARAGRNLCTATAMGVGACALLQAAVPLLQAFHGSPAQACWQGPAGTGLDLCLRMDGLAGLFVLLVAGIGLLVMLYAHYYLSRRDSLGRLTISWP
jgi:multicomponent K+:H+ antiporter subunit A